MFVEEKRDGEAQQISRQSQHLIAAADYIERHGWCQRYLERYDGATCLIGAIIKVAVGGTRRERKKSFTAYLQRNRRAENEWALLVARVEQFLQSQMALDYWNDAPGRTKEEVVRVLRACAAEGGPHGNAS